MLRRVGALRSTYVGEALNSEIYFLFQAVSL